MNLDQLFLTKRKIDILLFGNCRFITALSLDAMLYPLMDQVE